jgi:hypothetical protein
MGGGTLGNNLNIGSQTNDFSFGFAHPSEDQQSD